MCALPCPQAFTASHYLDASGRWGAMQLPVWQAFLSWLATTGVLTSKVQSRSPDGADSTSLDGLRAGDVGDSVPLDKVPAADLFTNEFLP